MKQDVRFALRILSKNRGFSLVALLTLTLGVGMVSSIFSIVEAVLVKGLPYERPEELVYLVGTLEQESQASDIPLSYLDVADFRRLNTVFRDFAGYSEPVAFNLSLESDAERVEGEFVTEGYFRILGVEPVLGRGFAHEDHEVPARNRVVLISHSLWQQRFGGDPRIAAESMVLNGESYHVLGVMPPGFGGVTEEAGIWLPLTLAATVQSPKYVESRRFRWLQGLGRLAEGQTLGQARAEMGSVVASLAQEYPDYQGIGVRLASLTEKKLGELRTPLWILAAASGFVLLIACTNVANLLLVRSAARTKELAVRTAVGASRLEITRQLLVESLILALAGGCGGLLLAYLSTDLLLAVSAARLPAFLDVRIDPLVVGFTLAVSVLCGVGFGLLAVLRTPRVDLRTGLQEGGRGSMGPGRSRLQGFLVVVQVSLTLILFIATGVMINGFRELRGSELGFRPQGLLTLRLDPLGERYAEDQVVWVLVRQILEGLSGLPGVSSVVLASPTIPTDHWMGYYGVLEDYPESFTDKPVVMLPHFITPGYFSAFGVPLREGRDFTLADTDTSQGVAIVSRSMAERYWPGESPIGKRLKVRRHGHEGRPWLHVVGVAEEVRHHGLAGDPGPGYDVYVPLLRVLSRDPTTLNVVLSLGDTSPEGVVPAVRDELAAIAPGLPPYDFATLESRLDLQMASNRLEIFLISLLAVIALLLAAVGLYGLMSYSVHQRDREIAIHMALGAQKHHVAGSVLRRGAALTGAGVSIGLLVGMLVVPRVLKSLIYEVESVDAWILTAASLLLLAVGLLASFYPALKATRVLPAIRLRSE